MREPYLVQRINKPYNIDKPSTPFQALAKYGLAVTGLSKEAKELLSEICVWDYMGSAEYEFGAIPKALIEIANSKLISKRTAVPYYFKRWKDGKIFEGVKDIGVICKEEDLKEVINYILKMAVGDPALRFKERPEVAESLAEYEYAKDVYGWLDLENCFMFFKNNKMFGEFCRLFGISVEN